LKINFLLPAFSPVPIGGYKVVYEYSDYLVKHGHEVTIIYPPWCNVKDAVSAANLLRQKVKLAVGPIAAKRLGDAKVSWFPLDDRVKQIVVPDLRERSIPDADATVATAWTTAPWVASYSQSKGKGYYLIQDFEGWDGLEEAVDKTWRLPLQKIVIAKWLMRHAVDLGVQDQTVYITVGLNFDRFRLINPIENRPRRITVLAHKAAWKGMDDGIQAVKIVRSKYPEVPVTFFGTCPRPTHLPDWIDYKHLPTPTELTQLYNDTSIFIHTSWTEGWGATPAEAMACGSAVVAAANGGVQDFVTDGSTALLAPVKNPDAMAKRVVELLEDEPFRVKIATAGLNHIRTLTWDKSKSSFQKLLESGLAG
jgi:glycosyltransferase involved in cell wall biosynthesis